MSPRSALPVLGLLLLGCGEWQGDEAALTARSVAPAQGMACDACHAYPLKDRNHDFHLNTAAVPMDVNGPITCLDCHNRSLRSQAVIVHDTLFQDPVEQDIYTSSRYPAEDARTPSGTRIRNLPILRVDIYPQNHPIPQPARPGSKPAFQEFITTAAHLNGTVDVAFNPRVSDLSHEGWGGDSASYNPEQETCSAVACHPGGKVYRWAADHKGLPELPPVDTTSP